METVSNCAASSKATRTSRRIRRAESFASNFLKNAVHLAHVSVPGRSRDWPLRRQTSNRRSQWRIRLDARSIAVPAIALIHRISTGNIPQAWLPVEELRLGNLEDRQVADKSLSTTRSAGFGNIMAACSFCFRPGRQPDPPKRHPGHRLSGILDCVKRIRMPRSARRMAPFKSEASAKRVVRRLHPP